MNINKINIPNPCSFGWDKMTITADTNGRHCTACNKVVVDFTQMTTIQLISYLEKNKGSRVCGYFKTSDTTASVWYQRPLLKIYERIANKNKNNFIKVVRLFFISLLLNLTGCVQHTLGEIIEPNSKNADKSQIDTLSSVKPDTIQGRKSEEDNNK